MDSYFRWIISRKYEQYNINIFITISLLLISMALFIINSYLSLCDILLWYIPYLYGKSYTFYFNPFHVFWCVFCGSLIIILMSRIRFNIDNGLYNKKWFFVGKWYGICLKSIIVRGVLLMLLKNIISTLVFLCGIVLSWVV